MLECDLPDGSASRRSIKRKFFALFVPVLRARSPRMTEQSLGFRDLEHVPDDFVAQHAATCTSLDLTENMIKCVQKLCANASPARPI